jgi:hypothetical protein
MATIDGPFPGGCTVLETAGANFYPLPPVLARPAARLWPNGAWGLFARLEKSARYVGSYLRWPADHGLETNFYLGAPKGVDGP